MREPHSLAPTILNTSLAPGLQGTANPALLPAATPSPVGARPPAGIEICWAEHQDQVRQAQRLRYQVFAGEMGARLPNTIPHHDIDLFDDFCEHLLVRDVASGEVIGTYRVLTPAQAKRVGSTYSDTEFDLTRLRSLRERMVELGRSCVHPDHRHGGVIMALWTALGGFMQRNRLDIMVGCASIPMWHNGVVSGDAAASIWHQLKQTHLAPIELQVRPRLPLPVDQMDGSLQVEPPALIKGYLRLGAKILGAPAWDPDFNSADLPMLMRIEDLPSRYRKHFLGGLMRAAFDPVGAWLAPHDSGAERHGDDDHEHDGEHGRHRYRAVFISDLHLGTPGCQASALLAFLKAYPSDTLYLVGDIVDGWQLRRKWYWPQSHNDVVQKLLRRARKGGRVIFVPGNHDEFARPFVGHHFGGIEVMEQAVHTTADGRQLWVVHGDYFDGVIQCAKWLAYLGDNLYEFTLKLNRHLNSARARMGLPYWSLSAYLKHKVKKALNYVTDFERAVATEARRRGHDGVVCGHIHRAEMRHIDGTLYCNDGDWVESRTALVEHFDGHLELVHWQADDHRPTATRPVMMALGQTA